MLVGSKSVKIITNSLLAGVFTDGFFRGAGLQFTSTEEFLIYITKEIYRQLSATQLANTPTWRSAATSVATTLTTLQITLTIIEIFVFALTSFYLGFKVARCFGRKLNALWLILGALLVFTMWFGGFLLGAGNSLGLVLILIPLTVANM